MNATMAALFCGLLLGADGGGSLPADVITPDQASCVWTGKEMFLWNGGPQVAAFDPAKNIWRAIKPTLPRGRIVSQGFLRLSDGTILAAYWNLTGNGQLCFDRCWPKEGRWRRIAAIDCKEFKDSDGKPYDTLISDNHRTWFTLDVLGMAALSDGAVVFVDEASDPVAGIRIGYDGRTKWISRKNAPLNCGNRNDTAVYALGDKVLCLTYARVDVNLYGVWNAKSDTWSKPEECARRYDFSHCQLGDEVYVFGGAESSAFGWIKKDGAVYSFSKNQWQPLPMKSDPQGRRGGIMCAAGDRVLLWGGDNLFGEPLKVVIVNGQPQVERSGDPLPNTVMAFEPAKQQWRAANRVAMPPARSHVSAVWTGKEMIVWGGTSPPLANLPLHDGFAFDPQTGRWRSLPDLPKQIAIRPK
jgi:hypothetical protein